MSILRRLFKKIVSFFKKKEEIEIKQIKSALYYMTVNDTSEEYFSGSYGSSDHNHSEGRSHREID